MRTDGLADNVWQTRRLFFPLCAKRCLTEMLETPALEPTNVIIMEHGISEASQSKNGFNAMNVERWSGLIAV